MAHELVDCTVQTDMPFTNGGLAMINLQAQIEAHERRADGLESVRNQAEFIELIALQGHVLGRIADYELAEEMAERLLRYAPGDGTAFVARAGARSRFHRFTDALADLDQAERFGADTDAVDRERAAIFQAIGKYECAFTMYLGAAGCRSDFNSLGALATLHAERGEIAAAEQFFNESQSHYRGVSPIPVALLDFQRGLMWMRHGDLHRAHTWFETAVHLLPAYVTAQGHLAELEAALGERDCAIARLLPLTKSSDDPDYAASLARILGEAGRVAGARGWRNKAVARYDELMECHPEAFADHAAEFWLEAGNDPDRAVKLAKMNLEVRQTPRAHDLLTRAVIRSEAHLTDKLLRRQYTK